MKLLIKSFVNPLLAIAFKDGVDFVGDPDYKALEPKQEGPNKWTVAVEHEDDDDDDNIEAPAPIIGPQPQPRTMQNYKDKFDKMKPVPAKSAPSTATDIVHFPVKPKVPRYPEPEPLPDPPGGCGKCIPCSQGYDCLEVIAAACQEQERSMGLRTER